MTTTQAGILFRHLRGLAAAGPLSQHPDRQLLERFTTGGDEAAFETLLRRHGPMVLGVCRRVLHDPHDADDAFQATFLVLTRKAASISKRDSVGGWLYQVAYNMALKAKASATARQRHERRAGDRSPVDPLTELTGRELVAVLDEVLQQLPERYRAPLVLCYLEGKTRDEAAQQLGWTMGTLKRRLQQARTSLRRQLQHRGLAMPAALLAAQGDGHCTGGAGRCDEAGGVAAHVRGKGGRLGSGRGSHEGRAGGPDGGQAENRRGCSPGS
jgi:RNA polymerase sigma-70 factor (ECF subfamily)